MLPSVLAVVVVVVVAVTAVITVTAAATSVVIALSPHRQTTSMVATFRNPLSLIPPHYISSHTLPVTDTILPSPSTPPLPLPPCYFRTPHPSQVSPLLLRPSHRHAFTDCLPSIANILCPQLLLHQHLPSSHSPLVSLIPLQSTTSLFFSKLQSL